jgi:hypothetical protein
MLKNESKKFGFGLGLVLTIVGVKLKYDVEDRVLENKSGI